MRRQEIHRDELGRREFLPDHRGDAQAVAIPEAEVQEYHLRVHLSQQRGVAGAFPGDDSEVGQLIQERGNPFPHQPVVFDKCY